MKTPMQELISAIRKRQEDEDVQPFMWHEQIVELAESMLEKEKEVMCEFAFNCGDEIKDQNNWRSPRNLTNYEVIRDFYNETFSTKEK